MSGCGGRMWGRSKEILGTRREKGGSHMMELIMILMTVWRNLATDTGQGRYIYLHGLDKSR